jgi:membrane protein required for beta-lactamase induction
MSDVSLIETWKELIFQLVLYLLVKRQIGSVGSESFSLEVLLLLSVGSIIWGRGRIIAEKIQDVRSKLVPSIFLCLLSVDSSLGSLLECLV